MQNLTNGTMVSCKNFAKKLGGDEAAARKKWECLWAVGNLAQVM